MSTDPTQFQPSEEQDMMSLHSLIAKETLQWIFVGGKGGVGKTTTSCSLATLLARTKIRDRKTNELRQRQVLIISTDPAHNLSDAFNQKFTSKPTAVNGLEGLFGMEVDPSSLTDGKSFVDQFGIDTSKAESAETAEGLQSLTKIIKQAANSLPGIDEVTVFTEIMSEIKQMKFDTVVFDTAPTGHTLRLLALPQTLNETIDKLFEVQGLTNLISSATQLMTASTGVTKEGVMDKIANWRERVKEVQSQFADNSKTTFVCVCIPEFLSVYETERLVQELMKYNIDVENIVVNQLVMKPSSEPACKMCAARQKIQGKYLAQIKDLYEDFHVIQMPMHCDEVRGVEALKQFSRFLVIPYDVERDGLLPALETSC